MPTIPHIALTPHQPTPIMARGRFWPGADFGPGTRVNGLDAGTEITIHVDLRQLSPTRPPAYSAAGCFFLAAALRLRKRAARSSLTTWRLRPMASASAGTSWV